MKNLYTLIYKKYLLVSALTRISKMPAKAKHDSEALLDWARKSKIAVKMTDPLYCIKDSILKSENYTLSNQLSPAVGYKKVSSFILKIHTPPHVKRHPHWNEVLIQCPEEWIKEGVGLWVDMGTAMMIDPVELIGGGNLQVEVWIYYKAPLISKQGLAKISDKKLKDMFDKGQHIWNAPENRLFAWLFIEREYYKRFDRFSVNYQKYLDIDTVRHNIYALSDTTTQHTDKENYLRELKKLKEDMKENPIAYWKYQHID